MNIDWELDAQVSDETLRSMARAAECAQKVEGMTLPLATHVLITDDARIHEINRQQRGVDKPTDVLSFPTVNYPKGKTARDCARLLQREYDDDADGCMLGDVVISLEHAQAQAKEYGHGVKRELCYLFVHGLFHLFGYDHMEDKEKSIMREQEEKALSGAGATRGELPSDEELLMLAREAMKNAYVPYSHYAVGACLLCKSGRVITGCNVENASYGLCNCAERTAVFKAVSEGENEFIAIAIAADSSAPWPCGACRQVLNEFAPDIRVLVTWKDGRDERTLSELLPCAFGPKSLQ